ncbi:MAG: hypothetical protein ACREIC_25460, partial [Limisphaerales bacterium]
IIVLDVLPNSGPVARAINHDGAGVVRVLGLGYASDGSFGPSFLWKQTEGGEPSLLIAPAGYIAAGYSGAVNKSGQVANTHDAKAWLWEETHLWDGQPTDLGGFGGSLAYADDINDAGQVVGAATLADRTASQRAFIYQNGSMTDLNKLAPVGKLVLQGAIRINNSGQILAFAAAQSPGQYPAILLTPNP